MTTHRRRSWPKEANLVNLFLHIWQLMMPTLNQRLGSFPTESRAEIFPQCRQDYPLPPPINRGGFQGLKEEKIRSKVSQKISIFSVSATFSLSFCLSRSLFVVAFGHHHSYHLRFITVSTTSGCLNSSPTGHQAATATLSLLLPAFLSTGHQAATATLSLLLPAFLSPLQTFFFFLH